VNLAHRKGIKKISVESIQRFADSFNVLNVNHHQLKRESRWRQRDTRISNHEENLDLIAVWLREKLGATKAEVIQATQFSKMAGGTLSPEDVSCDIMMKSRPELRKYVQGVLDRGELYNDLGDADEDWDEDDPEDVGDDSDDSDDDDVNLYDLRDPENAFLAEDTAEEKARKKAQRWIRFNKPRHLPGESEDEYSARITLLYSDGIRAREEVAQRRTRATVPEQEEDAEGTAQVGAAARRYYEAQRGKTEPKPFKIKDHKDIPAQGRVFLVWWHDVGYAGQDRECWKHLDYCLKFPGLVEDYQAVSTPPPLNRIYFCLP
jgi:hypothetical protein